MGTRARIGLALLLHCTGLIACARDRHRESAPRAESSERTALHSEPPSETPKSAIEPAAPARRVLDGGLVIEDLIAGDGPPCPPGAIVQVNFTASFGGKVYDSSAMRKRPLSLPLSSPSLIEGLKRGIPGMRVGGTRRIEIPWRLAYGESGRDPIPPKTDLVFEVELLEFTTK